MVDRRDTLSIIPKQVSSQLGLQHEPTEKAMIQLDGLSLNSLGLIRDASLTLHSCPNFMISKYIHVIYFLLTLVYASHKSLQLK